MEKNKKLIVFLDQIGRTIIGECVSADKVLTKVKNPSVVNITPNPQTGQISLQLLPLFFREFLADASESTTWSYHSDIITICEDVDLDFKFIAQYQQIFASAPAQPQGKEPGTIKLFDA